MATRKIPSETTVPLFPPVYPSRNSTTANRFSFRSSQLCRSHVSVTIPIAKRVPIMPWLKIPQATITFQGTARVFPAAEASPELLRAILMHKADDREMVAGSCIVEITPVGEFVTYGVGIRLMDMREPAKARGRAPVL